jgi:non-specific serine/threonine protein kinase
MSRENIRNIIFNDDLSDFMKSLSLDSPPKKKKRRENKNSSLDVIWEEEAPELIPPYHLFPHQMKTVKWALERKGCILNLEMGLGKTLIALAIVNRSSDSLGKPSLFVCNKSIVNAVTTDITKFFGSENMPALVFHREFSTDVSRLTAVKIVIATYDTLTAKKTPQAFFDVEWNWVICDESQRLINMKTKLFKTVHTRLKSQRRMCMSGTPVKNEAEDLRSQLLFTGSVPKEDVLVMSVDEVNLNLPPKNEEIVSITMSEDEMDQYVLESDKMKQAYTDFQDKKTPYTRVTMQLMTTRKLLAGLRSKFTRALKIIQEHKSDKLIVFSGFSPVLCAFQTFLGEKSISSISVKSAASIKKRAQMFQTFRTTESARVLLIGPIGSVGLNLVEANHIVMLEPSLNCFSTEQVIARTYRIGQTKPVFVWHLLVKDTIEERIMDKSATIINDELREAVGSLL